MQRAAAATPHESLQPLDQVSEEPPRKRQKVSETPSTSESPSLRLQQLRSTFNEEESKCDKIIDKIAEEAGETKWVLNVVAGHGQSSGNGLHVVTTGYSDIDQGDRRSVSVGRMSFGKFNREFEVAENRNILAGLQLSGFPIRT